MQNLGRSLQTAALRDSGTGFSVSLLHLPLLWECVISLKEQALTWFFLGLFPQPHDAHGSHGSVFQESESCRPAKEREILERAGEWSQIAGAEGLPVWYTLREPVKGNKSKKTPKSKSWREGEKLHLGQLLSHQWFLASSCPFLFPLDSNSLFVTYSMCVSEPAFFLKISESGHFNTLNFMTSCSNFWCLDWQKSPLRQKNTSTALK